MTNKKKTGAAVEMAGSPLYWKDPTIKEVQERATRNRVAKHNVGYGPGGIGLDLEALLAIHAKMVVFKNQAIHEGSKAKWFLYYKEKQEFDRTRFKILVTYENHDVKKGK